MNQKNRKMPETEEELLDAFLDLLGEVAPDTEEEVDAFLRASGYDPEELIAQAESTFKEALETSPLDWRNRARQELSVAKKRMTQQGSKTRRSREENIAAIQMLQQRYGQAMAAHFRNSDLDNISDGDLESIREEYEFLQADDEDTPTEND